MEKIFKTFPGIIKAVDQQNHTVDVIVSTSSTDRHMESVPPEAYKKRLKIYKDHPILLSSHDYWSLTRQIGEAVSIKITDEGLLAKFKYYVGEGNPEADWAFNLTAKGIAAYSVGFISHEFENTNLSWTEAKESGKPLRVYKDVELIEISQVLIPSNRDAVQEQMGKALEESQKEKELITKSAGKKEPVLLRNFDYDAFAEMCTKALETSGLLTTKETPAPEKTIPAKDLEAHVLTAVKAAAEDPEFKKGLALSFVEVVKSTPSILIPVILECVKTDEGKKVFKQIILDAVEEMADEEFYRELLFGKAVKTDHKPSHGADLGEALTQIARDIKLN